MDSLRLAPGQRKPAVLPCCGCLSTERSWDRLAGRVYCPECQEALVLGVGDPMVVQTEKRPCSACDRIGTVRFLTFPLQGPTPVEMDLCPEHLRRLLGRRLSSAAFVQLRHRLRSLGLGVEQIFLLHDAFYDKQGRALQPALEPD
ncbi:MAG TPA: hypothetical protein VKU02_03660 [Gemmataceae bacterium]|nr:hypothetical protein [Gemmataceae bacterium]